MLIECSRCQAKVHARVLHEREYPPSDHNDPNKIAFLECPSCEGILLGYSEWIDFGDASSWSDGRRLWPDPHNYFDRSIPTLVRNSLDDARKCFQSQVYTACAVMCGRAIEALCKEKTGETTLYKGITKLKENGIIDDRLFEWGNALRKERNIGAHASDETISKRDAADILDFAMAITDYIYVLSEKFENYKSRKSNNDGIIT